MTFHHLSDPNTTIGEILRAAGTSGLLVEGQGGERYAILPLDDDVIDHLIERNPKLRAECAAIRQRMAEGQYHTHAAVRAAFQAEED